MAHKDKTVARECEAGKHIRCNDEDCECSCHSNANAGVLPQRVVSRY
jgi:hypothetical protein